MEDLTRALIGGAVLSGLALLWALWSGWGVGGSPPLFVIFMFCLTILTGAIFGTLAGSIAAEGNPPARATYAITGAAIGATVSTFPFLASLSFDDGWELVLMLLCLIAVVGAVVGLVVARRNPPVLFARIVGGAMVGAIVLALAGVVLSVVVYDYSKGRRLEPLLFTALSPVLGALLGAQAARALAGRSIAAKT